MHPVKWAPASAAILTLCVLAGSPARATPSVCDAISGNLVQNCGFEGGFTAGVVSQVPDDWSFTPGAVGSVIAASGDAHSGTFSLDFSANGPGADDDEIFQAIATTVGDKYQISFWAFATGGSNDFSADFGGSTLISLSPFPHPFGSGFDEFTYTEIASATSETLAFFGQGGILLDDVSVVDAGSSGTPVPEPASLAMFGTALIGLNAIRRRKRR